jgi:hypothetical protein
MLCDDKTLDISKSVECPFKILTGSTTTNSSIIRCVMMALVHDLAEAQGDYMHLFHIFEFSHNSSFFFKMLEISLQENVFQKLRNTDLKA